MRTHKLILASACFSLTFAAAISADEQQDAARLQELLTEIQKVVPHGWVTELEFVDSKNPHRPGTHPALVIKSDTKLPVEALNVANPPGQSEDEPEPPPQIFQLTVSIHFVPLPYLSQQKYAQARKENEQLIQRRIEYERDHLPDVDGGFMGPEPIPPNFYHPKTKDEKQRVMQYAFLWTSTEPRQLPTHHTDQLSIEMRYLPLDSIAIHDEKRSKEYKQILHSVHKIILPYENKP